MIKGVLSVSSGAGVYITDEKQSRCVSVRPGQYLYLSVNGCWVPVIIRYSSRLHSWVFQNLENIDVDGQKVMLK